MYLNHDDAVLTHGEQHGNQQLRPHRGQPRVHKGGCAGGRYCCFDYYSNYCH